MISQRWWSRRVGPLLAALALGCGPGGCAADGKVEIEFLLPTDERLVPALDELAHVSLTARVPGEPERSETRQVMSGAEPIDLGEVPVGDGLTLAVELRSPTQRLIGYGRSAPIDVVAGEVTVVPIMLRRPFAYVAGGPGVATFDATRDSRDDSYRGAIALDPRPSAVAATHAGGDLVIATPRGGAGELALISTADHQRTGGAATELPSPPSAIALSEDDRFIVIGHAGADGGLSIVRMDEARAGAATAQFVRLGSVEAVAVAEPGGQALAYALVDRSEDPGCPAGEPDSKVVIVGLANPEHQQRTVRYPGPATDFAVDPTTGFIAVADACSNSVYTLDPDPEETPQQLMFLAAASAVAMQDGRVWAIGANPSDVNTGARLTLASIDIDGSGETRLDLPEQQESATSVDFSGAGQYAEVRMSADTLRAYDLAVVPGADHVAVLVRANYHSEAVGDIFGQPIIPGIDLEAYEYMLVDAATATPAQRVRTYCSLSWERDPLNPPFLDDWDCSTAPDQDVVPAAQRYVPVQLDVLYGAR